jgi:uncharacterized beta-barrel protein YwiB (DUF1934 family)
MKITIHIKGKLAEAEKHCEVTNTGVVEAKKNNDPASDAIRGYLC